jgi:hypothetical protein
MWASALEIKFQATTNISFFFVVVVIGELQKCKESLLTQGWLLVECTHRTAVLFLRVHIYPFPEACFAEPWLDIPLTTLKATPPSLCLAYLSLQRLGLYFTCSFKDLKQPL